VQWFLRIYAVIFLVLYVTGLPGMLSRIQHVPVINLIDMAIFSPIAIVGLWSAAYRHINLPKTSWKALLFVSVFWRPITLGNAVLFEDAIPKFLGRVGAFSSGLNSGAADAVMLAAVAGACMVQSLLILTPLVALYRNAYGDESLLKLMSPSRITSRQTAT
jgi:hypothetical protein